MMKKMLTFIVTAAMLLTLAACGGNPAQSSESSSAPQTSSSQPEMPSSSSVSSQPTESSSEASSQPAEPAPSSSPVEPASLPEPQSTEEETSPSQPEEQSGGKVLVAYFSATNTTEGVAQTIAASVGADLYEITPAQPYTSADLNYNDDNSRSTKEMNDPSARPEISGSVADMSQYDIVFLGYPIWWGEAPRIINTFVESYDFSGKTIVPFCTSGGSGMGSSATNLQSSASGATWLSGRRLNSGVSQSEIAEWVNGLELGISAA